MQIQRQHTNLYKTMKTAILLTVALIFVSATNVAPLATRCMELINSTRSYAYCDVMTNSSQGDDRLYDLVYTANNVTATFQLICQKGEYKEKVSVYITV